MSTIDPEFDLIRLDPNKNVGGVWIGTAISLHEAVETIRVLAATKPGKFMYRCLKAFTELPQSNIPKLKPT
jgi:hypothetical protein